MPDRFEITRIRLLLKIQAGVSSLVLAMLVALGSSYESRTGMILCGLSLLILGVSYAFSHTRLALVLIYLNLVSTLVLLALAGPVSGNVDGSIWALYQIPPLIATLVLNRPRITISIALLAAVLLVTTVMLEFTDVIHVDILLPKASLQINLFSQVLTLGVVSITVWVLAGRSQASLASLQAAQQQTEAQLERERMLAQSAEQARAELAQTLRDLQLRDSSLAQEQAEQQRLRSLLSQASTPVIPLLKGVVVMPLIGAWDAARSAELIDTLLEGIERNHARLAIIDVTGLNEVAPETGAALLRAAAGARLLGATPILAGISPEIAQILVMHEVALEELVVHADLQSAVDYALRSRPGAVVAGYVRR